MKPKRGRARWLLAALSVLISLAVLEAGLRGYYFFKNRTEPPFSVRAERYGWVSAPNRSMSFVNRNFGPIRYSTNPDGFRAFGNPASDKTKIFCVGDSYTQAYQVSDGQAYFDVLAKARTDVEVFAYGAGGYGTLQEVMAIERFAPRIRPDIVVVQFHANDIINNDHRLESASREHNNHMRRPYYENGRIVLRHPDVGVSWLSEVSLVARRLVMLKDSSLRRSFGSVETRLQPSHPGLARSLETTRRLLRRAQEAIAGAELVLMPVPSGESYPYESILEAELCDGQTWRCVGSLRERLEAARAEGLTIDGGTDLHWNATGHRIAGQALLDNLVRASNLPAGPS